MGVGGAPTSASSQMYALSSQVRPVSPTLNSMAPPFRTTWKVVKGRFRGSTVSPVMAEIPRASRSWLKALSRVRSPGSTITNS